MVEGAADPAVAPGSITFLAREARRDAAKVWRELRLPLVFTFLLVVVLESTRAHLESLAAQPFSRSVLGLAAAGLFGLEVVLLLPLSAITVPVCRLVLLGESARSLQWQRIAAVACWGVLLIAASALLAVPILFGLSILRLPLVVALIYLLLRLSFVIPSVAVGEHVARWTDRIADSWRLTRGWAVKLFLAELLAVLPIGLAILVPYICILRALLAWYPAAYADMLSGPWVRPVVYSLMACISTALQSAVVSHAYRIVRTSHPLTRPS